MALSRRPGSKQSPVNMSVAKPDCFLSYSMAEPTGQLLSTVVWIVFQNDFTLRLTPSALTSGSSQLTQIESQIAACAFGIVCLDGLRPNVIHEYGFMRGIKKPVILLKTKNATVDVRLFLGASAQELANPTLDVNVHLSNLKDINHATWYPDDPPKSAKAIWEEYNKMRKEFSTATLADVKEPHLW